MGMDTETVWCGRGHQGRVWHGQGRRGREWHGRGRQGHVWRGQGRRGHAWYRLGRRGCTWHGDSLRGTCNRRRVGWSYGLTAGLDEKGESKSSGGGSKEAKGKDGWSKTTCPKINMRFVVRSRHRYPYDQTNTQGRHTDRNGGLAYGEQWHKCSGNRHTRRPKGGRRREWCQKEQSMLWGLRSPLWVGG
jgi:hypothetical protein